MSYRSVVHVTTTCSNIWILSSLSLQSYRGCLTIEGSKFFFVHYWNCVVSSLVLVNEICIIHERGFGIYNLCRLWNDISRPCDPLAPRHCHLIVIDEPMWVHMYDPKCQSMHNCGSTMRVSLKMGGASHHATTFSGWLFQGCHCVHSSIHPRLQARLLLSSIARNGTSQVLRPR